uniref:Glycoside hydrolase, family 3-like n=1 Tax=mine drainage metagenome TaxID=410659 RepID=E6QN94_9ZZZZ
MYFALLVLLANMSGVVCGLFAEMPQPVLAGPVPDSPAIEASAHAMLARLTLEQKIELLGGVDGMFTQAIPAIDLPRLKMSDGPLGVRSWGPTTAYAGGAALAASWDPALARQVGEGLGRDARARGVDFLLGPGVNISRSPVSGRNFEYLSEDPYLNAQLAVEYIEGVQAQGVSATVKHFAANNQEYDRHNVSSDVDERTLRELYLPAFEAAVKVARVTAVMDSYNMLNGVHSTQNNFLNVKLLKDEWGFDGVLMSDWDATYDGVAAANNGMDLEMPNARFMNEKTLLPAVKAGKVTEATINDKILRLFRVALRYGWIGSDARPQQVDSLPTYSVADRAIALQGAQESITLLKNEGNLLPLSADKVKTIAVIGPDAYPAVPGGGGSSQAQAFDPVSILTGLANLAAKEGINVVYARGLPLAGEVFGGTYFEGKVQVESFDNRTFDGKATVTQQERINDLKPAMWDVEDPHQRSLRYTAIYKPTESGKFLLLAGASGEDAYTVTVDGKQVIEQPHREGQFPQAATLTLTAGKPVRIVTNYIPRAPGIRMALGLMPESKLISADARRLASEADAVVLSVGFDPETESEGLDRSFTLPWGQDVLMDAVATANPKTIVALTAGGAVDTSRWLGKVPAFLQTYYPGQEGGTAVAEALLGKINPEGKLPVTFDRSFEDDPTFHNYYSAQQADGLQHVHYAEKLMVGYRYWTTTGKHPLYPFGYGLSYTTFAFSNLKVDPSLKIGGSTTVSFDVTNTGKVAGAEVAQLYVSEPNAAVTRPERELKGFEKVRLAPGETKTVTLSLGARSFSYWDEATHGWKMDAGKFVIHVGDSSEATPLETAITAAP